MTFARQSGQPTFLNQLATAMTISPRSIGLFLTRTLRYTAGLLAIGLVACSSTGTTPTPSTNYVRVTLNGQTKTYTNVKLDEEAVVGSLRLWSIAASADENEYLSISLWGTGTGVYPYKPTMNAFNQVSQIGYKTKDGMLANYAALICSDQSGYYTPQGAINVTQYTNGKVAKGTFSGALMSGQDADNCNKQGTPFRGEFSFSQ